MTLEDFFTPTELKDGFTDSARVKELFAVIQEENDSDGKNVGDSIRQWSTIASAIAATHNKDCLDIFAQLNGRHFISRLLEHAQNFRTETGDSLVEDLLRILEKLQDIEVTTPVEDEGISPLNDNENNGDHPGYEPEKVDTQTCEKSLDRATMTDDAEQMQKNISSYEKLAVPLEQRDESPSDDVTNTSDFAIESDLKENIDAKDRDSRITNKKGECNSDHLQDSSGIDHNNLRDSGVVVEAMEQANDGAENDSGGAKILDCETEPQDSPDTKNGGQKKYCDGSPSEVQTGPDVSMEASSMGEEPHMKTENLGVEQGSCIHDFSSITKMAQEQEVSTEKGLFGFDLNQELFSDDVVQQLDLVSTLVSVDSPHGTHNSSKQREDCVDFDLNVAEGIDDDKIIESLPQKQIVMSSRIPSGESSVEASPRKSERLHLDLNRVSDGSDDGLRSPSPSSTSSSMQPAFRNIDLNGQPSFQNDYSNYKSVISIMGARVQVNRQNFVPQTLPSPHLANMAGPDGVMGLGPGASQYVGLVPGSSVYRPGGPIPYTGSTSSAALSQMPYIMSMNTDTSGGLRQLFSDGGSVDGQITGSKRKEVDGGWEFYPVNFKHHQPPWI